MLLLVVDDEADVETLFRQQFRRELRAGRFEIGFANSGPQALELIAAQGSDVILILSDINMPGMSGFDLLERARALRPDVPMIMISAYGDAATLARARAGGAENVLAKPVDFVALRAEVERRLAGP